MNPSADQLADQLQELDEDALVEELDHLQARLDRLAAGGTNPYEIARLQRGLDAARAELQALVQGSGATGAPGRI